ncbi:MAG: hypothetical protein PHO67_07850 [Candidatus Omnitrophica bacterium]|nr:hypothetical protein [Candidatus Omnitrophota bacterium]
MMRHCCIALDTLLRLTLEGQQVLVDAETGEPLEEREIYELVKEMRKDGNTVFTPGCDNVDKQGRCAGHKE